MNPELKIKDDPITSTLGLTSTEILRIGILVTFGLLLLVLTFRRYNVRYQISNDGAQALRGFLSNNQIDSKLEYYQIRSTEIHRTLFERLVGTGNLNIRGSTSNDSQVEFKGIFSPYLYQQLIQLRHREEVQGGQSAWMNN